MRQLTPCPHCSGPGISGAAKRLSSREYPAACSLCGGLSHAIASTSAGILVVTLGVLGGFFVLGAVVGHVWLVGLAGLPIALAYRHWAWRRAELVPISGSSSAAARKGGWLAGVLWILSLVG